VALGRRNNRNSYGVPVRPAPAPAPEMQPVSAAVPAMATGAAAPVLASGTSAPDFYSPAPAAPSSYSGPGTQPTWQDGSPPWSPSRSSLPPPAPARPARSRARGRIGSGLLIALALAGIRGGCSALSQSADIEPPTTISGYVQVHGAQIDGPLDAIKSEIQQDNPGKGVAVAAYGTNEGEPMFALALLRGRVDIDKELKDARATSRKSFGPITCAKTATAGEIGCIWSGSVSGAVFTYGMKMADAAAIAKEARDAP